MGLFQKPALSVRFAASTQQGLKQGKEEEGEPMGLVCRRVEAPGASAFCHPQLPADFSAARLLIKDEQAAACAVCGAPLLRGYRKVCKYYEITWHS